MRAGRPGDPHLRPRGPADSGGLQVADDAGQTAWISGAGAIAVFGEPLGPGETTQAGPLWLFDDFNDVKDMGPCSPPFMAEIARALGERYEPA